ncbi:Lrp/AsnC family transcriptional regulator [Paraburkholderia sp. CNPSo 3274]|uniref:Lrp/AsnC family transcriptional regulator n=1 Tax=Paraburkholderia sp. CNPSo 3274 TaxID=2940932 RepID=UPI0020B6A449|nr:Lrp/AsnC family transcriptional regulator [Paraburkholderia sp. CNPSo 3274]MCP3705837.1 Lrp/AsnC family transcriptional regulator [Paraburkholderia sp. CNPSo 3274]
MLLRDGRAPYKSLAAEVGLTAQACSRDTKRRRDTTGNRVRQLQPSGAGPVKRGMRAQVNATSARNVAK